MLVGNKKITILLLFLAAMFLLSCHSEKKIARAFVLRDNIPALYITFNNNWQLFFKKPTGATFAESYARRNFPYRIYSLKNEGFKQVDSLFTDSFLGKLKQNGFAVFADSATDAFFASDNRKFVVEILQIYVEESVQHAGDTLFLTEYETIPYDTVISRVDFSFWLRINPVDDTLLAAPTLFASFAITDFFQGSWSYDLGNDSYVYSYSYAPLEMCDVMEFIPFCGRKLGQYIYDYFMNMWVYEHSRTTPENYYTGNGRTVKAAGSDRFVFMSGN